MAREPDDLAVRNLRDIQATLGDHGKILEQHSSEFKKMNHELTDRRETTLAAAGLSVNSSVKFSSLRNQIDNLDDRSKRIEEKVDEKA